MGVPISVRLEDDVRAELEAQAKARGVGLSTLLRDIAAHAAREARRARMRVDSEMVGAYVARDEQAGAFYTFWGTNSADHA